MEVRARLQKTFSSVSVVHMIEHEKLSFLSIATAVAVVVAMYIFSDAIKATLAAPNRSKTWMRLRWLKMRGLEEYVGRHRWELINA